MPDSRAGLSVGFVLLVGACTAKRPEPEQVEESPPAAVEPTPPPVVQAPPVIEKTPEPPPPPVEKPITPTPATTQWREIPGMESIVDFHPFVYGVLVICGPDGLDSICKLRDDDTLEETPVEFPEVDSVAGMDRGEFPVMTGNWRSDAWLITNEARNVEVLEDPEDRGALEYDLLLVLRKLRTDAWFPSPIGDAKRVKDTGQRVRKGWAGGLLVWDDSKFIRVPAASEPPAPTRGATKEGTLLDFFEAESGRLYTVVTDADHASFVQRPCTSPECVIANAVPLPVGGWSFDIDIPRGKDSISVVADHRSDDDQQADYLIHFDAGVAGGRWVLDRWPTSDLVRVPTMMWPDTREGMWVRAGDALWYRDAQGDWFDVALPFAVEPGDVIRFANRMKPREFVVLLVRGGVGRVFATKGPPRAP